MAVTKLVGRGGKRPGAGRPPKLETAIKKAERLTKQLNAAVKLGLMPLIANYPQLMETAIHVALGANKDGKVVSAPNVKMLEFLIALPMKLSNLADIPTVTGGERVLEKLFGSRSGTTQIINISRQQPVAEDRSNVVEGVGRVS